MSIAFYLFARRMLSSFSVDEMLLPRDVNFKGFPLRVKIVPRLKHMNSGLFASTFRSIPLAVLNKY